MPDVLTPRQLQIVRLVARSLTDKEIAAALGISYQTVHNTMTSIHRRLHVESRVATLIAAHQLGLVSDADMVAPRVADGLRWY
jgi:DNA-binding CsgD family transcriptional regulator